MENSDWISPNYSLTPPGDQDNDKEDNGGSEDVVVTNTAAVNCTLPFLLYRDYNVVTGTNQISRTLTLNCKEYKHIHERHRGLLSVPINPERNQL